jgi:hypothetical protein
MLSGFSSLDPLSEEIMQAYDSSRALNTKQERKAYMG